MAKSGTAHGQFLILGLCMRSFFAARTWKSSKSLKSAPWTTSRGNSPAEKLKRIPCLGSRTPGAVIAPIVPHHSRPEQSHFASLKRFPGLSSCTVASTSNTEPKTKTTSLCNTVALDQLSVCYLFLCRPSISFYSATPPACCCSLALGKRQALLQETPKLYKIRK